MLDYLYPTDERKLFTDREYHLGLLEMCCTELQANRRKHLALLGLRRIGKTLILKEFILRLLHKPTAVEFPPVIPVYLDLQRAGLSPEFLARQYVGSVLYWFRERGHGQADPYFNPATQLRVVTALGKPQTLDAILRLDQALQQSPVPQRHLLEQAFQFPEILATETDTRFLVILDEFQQLTRLSNYPQVGDALEIFRAILQTQSHVAYIVAGSAISLMERIFHHARSPLFVHFRSVLVGPFTREDTTQMARKALGDQPLSEPLLRTLFAWTYGHPFYVYAVAERMKEMALLFHRDIGEQVVGEAFVLETLSTTGRIYNLCRYVVEESMAQARGQALLRLALQILAQSPDPLSLTELSRRLQRSSGVTRNLLNRLAEVDLVVQQDATFDLRDPVLKVWLAYFHAGVELLAMPRREILEQLVADVSERFQRVSAELGLAKESQVREIMAAFDDREVPGALFGQSGTLRLPTFRRVAPFQTHDGQIELDAVADGEALWVVEIKWQNRLASRSDLERFRAKVRAAQPHLPLSPEALWFVAKAGFKDSALRFARQHGILHSTQLDLQKLAELLGLRFGK